MYPSKFRYEAPTSLDEAIGLLKAYGGEAKVLGGGQSLIPMVKLRFATPEVLIDINNLPNLGHLTVGSDGSARIGALCRHRDLERSPTLPKNNPTMAATAALIADPIVRTRGTLVGSLCHADPQGDWSSCMTALGASVVAKGPSGERTIPVNQFVLGPFENALSTDEIAVECRVPGVKNGTLSGGYLKLERRIGDFATAGVALALELSGGRVARAGLALTGVGSKTIECTAAQNYLKGKALDTGTIDEAARLAADAAEPRSDHRGSADYKRHMVAVFVTRLLDREMNNADAA
jgi:carbon-monoxide dehydrogenase medium subunit